MNKGDKELQDLIKYMEDKKKPEPPTKPLKVKRPDYQALNREREEKAKRKKERKKAIVDEKLAIHDSMEEYKQQVIESERAYLQEESFINNNNPLPVKPKQDKQPLKPQPMQVGGKRMEEIAKENSRRSLRKQKKKKIYNDKVSTARFLTELAVNKATHGKFETQVAKFQIAFNKIMSLLHHKVIYQIIQYDSYVKPGYLDIIKQNVLQSLPDEIRHGTDIYICHHMKECHVELNTQASARTLQAYKTGLAKKVKRVQHIQSILDGKKKQTGLDNASLKEMEKNGQVEEIRIKLYTEADLNEAKKEVSIRQRKIKSFELWSFHRSHGGSFVQDYVFLEVVTRHVEDLPEICKTLEQALTVEKIKYKEIILDLKQYLDEFGFGSLKGHNPKAKHGLDCLPMETISRIPASDCQFKSGIIRTRVPKIPIGVNNKDGYMVSVNFKEVSGAFNTIVYGQTQSGKSTLCMNIAMWTPMYPEFQTIYNDMKGTDTTYLKSIVPDAIEIPMGDRDPRFINTYKMPIDLDLGFKEPSDYYDFCFNFTSMSLQALIDPKPEDRKRVEELCNNIVSLVYMRAGVDKARPSTYRNCEKIQYRRHTWDAVLYATSKNPTMQELFGIKFLREVRTALEPHFSLLGSRSARYKNECSIDELSNASVVIFNYDSLISNLSQPEKNMLTNCKNFFTNILTFKNYRSGKTTIEFEDEFNSQVKNPLLAERISQSLRMHGSLRKINFLICNSCEFLSPEYDNGNVVLAEIRDSLNGIIIGKCNSVASIVKAFKLENLQDQIEEVEAHHNSNNSFYVHLPFENPIVANIHLPYNQDILSRLIPGHYTDTSEVESYLATERR